MAKACWWVAKGRKPTTGRGSRCGMVGQAGSCDGDSGVGGACECGSDGAVRGGLEHGVCE